MTHQVVAMINSFFLAMLIYPEGQKKAQAEIDTVIGPNRLPNFADRTNLPYVNATVKEVLRWHTVVPLGSLFPFCCNENPTLTSDFGI